MNRAEGPFKAEKILDGYAVCIGGYPLKGRTKSEAGAMTMRENGVGNASR